MRATRPAPATWTLLAAPLYADGLGLLAGDELEAAGTGGKYPEDFGAGGTGAPEDGFGATGALELTGVEL